MSLFWISVLAVAVGVLAPLAVYVAIVRRQSHAYPPAPVCARQRQPRRRSVHRTPRPTRRAGRAVRARMLRARIGGAR